MFSSGPNYTKLKTNLRLAVNRLKLLEKKKAELAQKSRKEIADYLATSKVERARIRVEHIIREDYLVEAMEIVEMYCDLLLARFGLVTQMKELDDGIAEAVCSIVWVCPRLQSDVPELKIISEIFSKKYGPQFAESSLTATGNHQVSEKLMHKLQLQAPPKLLVEKYLLAIAKNYNIEYEPDPQVMQEPGKDEGPEHHLIDLSDRNNLSGGNAPNIGFIGYPAMPELPKMPEPPSSKPFNYPPAGPKGGGGGGSGGGSAASTSGAAKPFAYNIPPGNEQPQPQPPQLPPSAGDRKDLNTQFINKEQFNDFNASAGASTSAGAADEDPDANLLRSNRYDDPPPRYSSINTYNINTKDASKPTPQPRSKFGPPEASAPPPSMSDLPVLPNVPLDLPDIPNDDDDNNRRGNNDDEIDFDDLSRRFENLKKKK